MGIFLAHSNRVSIVGFLLGRKSLDCARVSMPDPFPVASPPLSEAKRHRTSTRGASPPLEAMSISRAARMAGNEPQQMSALEAERRHYRPCVPAVLRVRVRAEPAQERTTCVSHEDLIASAFPTLYGSPVVSLVPAETDTSVAPRPLRVGCVLSGGTPAAGGHNCICGLFDHLEAFHPGSTLLGFRGGLRGVLRNSFTKLEAATVERHRNSGGFFMIGSGGDLIETEEELALAVRIARNNSLDGLRRHGRHPLPRAKLP